MSILKMTFKNWMLLLLEVIAVYQKINRPVVSNEMQKRN